MSRDPYHDFASDLRNSLQSARTLSHNYTSLLSSSSSSSSSPGAASGAIQEAHDRLADAIEGLRQDVQDVRESVAIVQRAGPERFGVGVEELEGRVKFVKDCEREIEELESIASAGVSGNGSRRSGSGRGGGAIALEMDEQEDSAAAFERDQQQQLMAEQDSSLGLLGRTLSTLRDQASHLGQEINEQVELLGALDEEVDQSQSRLKRAMDRMEQLIKLGDDRLGGWCVWILIVVLFLLLLVVVLI
ncbi:hypothetical protein OC846_000498 [Tilletia horrida]|uniref:t-SNARE coiled-coil homology domain-containing protein n=1 Tax=Tilletia horrida TaxID=155126 RepID=A0AAN6JX11_9BASI|nr:hypothetical protein OC846_000498 [Tilletia horrida]KAK0561439.1 hypothetical protein OC861_005819 [Tilletia horrida]